MADQNITELPVKTSSGMTSSDYMLGIDSAEGYQMLIKDLGDYIIRNVQVNTIAGANQTLKSALDTLNSNTALLMRPDSSGTLSSGNANNVTQTGNWLITNTSAVENIPSGLTGWWLLNVDRTYHDNNGNVLLQKLYRMGDVDQGVYMRGLSRTTWSNWVKMPTRAEVDTLINRGENLLNFSSYSDRTAAGVTFNKSGNVVIATGTCTNEDIVDIDRHLTLTAGTYCFGGTYGNTPWLQIMNDANTAQIGDSRNANPTLTFNSDTTICVRFHVTNGVTYSGLMTPYLCRIS